MACLGSLLLTMFFIVLADNIFERFFYNLALSILPACTDMEGVEFHAKVKEERQRTWEQCFWPAG